MCVRVSRAAISCPRPADVLFLLDGSHSITDADWAMGRVFVSTLLNSLEVSVCLHIALSLGLFRLSLLLSFFHIFPENQSLPENNKQPFFSPIVPRCGGGGGGGGDGL